MATKLEQLKTRLDKEQAKIAELTKSIEDEELSELQAEEFASMMVNVQEELAKTCKDILDNAGITLPAGKSFTIEAGETGELSVSTLAQKPARKASGGGGGGGSTRNTITIPEDIGASYPELADLAGKQVSWSRVCDAIGVVVGGASAHKLVLSQNKDLHDAIPHECVYA